MIIVQRDLRLRKETAMTNKKYDCPTRDYIAPGFPLLDGYLYQVGPSGYIGSFPIRTELEILPSSDPPIKGWTIGEVVSINGNKFQRLLGKYLKRKGKTSMDELTEEEIGKLYEKAKY
jgi:hypothetical protein